MTTRLPLPPLDDSPEPTCVTVDPEPPNPFDLIRDLPVKDAAFVRRYLETGDLSAACDAGGYSSDSLIGPRKLADPSISRAIVTCAPFVGDSKRAMKILTPYMLARLSSVAVTGRDAQAIGAIRDALTVAGEGRDADTKDLASLVRAMRAERQRIRGKGTNAPATTPALPPITKREDNNDSE